MFSPPVIPGSTSLGSKEDASHFKIKQKFSVQKLKITRRAAENKVLRFLMEYRPNSKGLRRR